jgi:Protein of unknown function (DUF3738)
VHRLDRICHFKPAKLPDSKATYAYFSRWQIWAGLKRLHGHVASRNRNGQGREAERSPDLFNWVSQHGRSQQQRGCAGTLYNGNFMSRAVATLCAIVSTALFGQLAEFEVASVRLHAIGVPGSYPPTGGVGTDDPERIVYNGFTLGALLLDAFDVKHSWRILGPDWLNGDLERYDVTAKIPAGATKEQFRLMMRHLLVDRFQIAWHWETKEVPGYSLVVGKNGPRFTVSETAKSECSKLHVGKGPDVQVSTSTSVLS